MSHKLRASVRILEVSNKSSRSRHAETVPAALSGHAWDSGRCELILQCWGPRTLRANRTQVWQVLKIFEFSCFTPPTRSENRVYHRVYHKKTNPLINNISKAVSFNLPNPPIQNRFLACAHAIYQSQVEHSVRQHWIHSGFLQSTMLGPAVLPSFSKESVQKSTWQTRPRQGQTKKLSQMRFAACFTKDLEKELEMLALEQMFHNLPFCCLRLYFAPSPF